MNVIDEPRLALNPAEQSSKDDAVIVKSFMY
jgi:hypothetical protein